MQYRQDKQIRNNRQIKSDLEEFPNMRNRNYSHLNQDSAFQEESLNIEDDIKKHDMELATDDDEYGM
jgi:hypothetical protein